MLKRIRERNRRFHWDYKILTCLLKETFSDGEKMNMHDFTQNNMDINGKQIVLQESVRLSAYVTMQKEKREANNRRNALKFVGKKREEKRKLCRVKKDVQKNEERIGRETRSLRRVEK